MLTIREFGEDDSLLLLRLKEQAGWNQTPADLARFRRLSPEGSFVAAWQGEQVGCVMTFAFGSVAWIAMMLVDEAFRGRGMGRALMEHALAYLDARDVDTVRLDATPLGQPLYEKLGFVPQFQVARYAGTPSASPREAAAEYRDAGLLLPAAEEQIEELIELDREATRTDRRELLLALFEQQPDELRLVIHDRRAMGYAVSRPGAIARQIGPCIAQPAYGSRLLADALDRHAGSNVFVDVPLDNQLAVEVAQQHGLQPARTLTRMNRGVPVIEDLDRLFASSSPEKG